MSLQVNAILWLMKRIDGRAYDELRQVNIALGYQRFAEGSTLIDVGSTRVLCAVSVEERIPRFLRGEGIGWITAEYAMLPRSTHQRTRRETSRPRGRSQEIRRLIGRSLRTALDLEELGERTIILDCDVLQADGGTRTASISGAYVALALALQSLEDVGLVKPGVLTTDVAAISLGLVEGQLLLDLCYEEDSAATADFNIVMTGEGQMIEVQGTAEGEPFDREAMDAVLDLAEKGISHMLDFQKQVLKR